jgi:hypothetical protein
MHDENSPLRAQVIESFINLEWLIHALISQHYFDVVRKDFIYELLGDEYCSFALKRRLMFKIYPSLSGDIEQKLNRLNTIRNYFGHVGQPIFESDNPAGGSRVPSPRDFSKSLDFPALHSEFVELYKVVQARLIEAYTDKGGQFEPAS